MPLQVGVVVVCFPHPDPIKCSELIKLKILTCVEATAVTSCRYEASNSYCPIRQVGNMSTNQTPLTTNKVAKNLSSYVIKWTRADCDCGCNVLLYMWWLFQLILTWQRQVRSPLWAIFSTGMKELFVELVNNAKTDSPTQTQKTNSRRESL